MPSQGRKARERPLLFKERPVAMVEVNRLKLDGFHGGGWSNGPVDQEQADEDQMSVFLDDVVEILQEVSACTGGDLKDALSLVRTRRNGSQHRSLLQAGREMLEIVPHVKRAQAAAARHGVKARPDVYCFSHLWLEDRDEDGANRFNIDWEYFVISVKQDGFHAGTGDSYHRNFDETELIGWDRFDEWLESQSKLVTVEKVQGS